MKKESLLNKIFNNLTVINENILTKSWTCKCICGNIKDIKASKLKSGHNKSCGCLKKYNNRAIDYSNKKINNLTILNKDQNKKRYWFCKCDCGNFTHSIFINHIISGHTTSCGCAQINIAKQTIKIAQLSNIKYSPEIAIAHSIWNKYYNEITFDQFYNLSQQNCYYCNNGLLNKRSDNEKNINFYYNGLDRINSKLNHSLNNVITCCIICNKAKRERSLNDFIDHIKNLNDFKINKNIIKNDIAFLNINGLKRVFYDKHSDGGSYNDSNITLEQFYKLSQQNCFYCNKFPNNKCKNFIYNGLDRLDNNLKHSFDNVVTCCKYCNYAKNNMTLENFYLWIDNVYNNLKNKQLL